MKTAFKSLIVVSLLILIFTGCGKSKERETEPVPSERKQYSTVFQHVNLVPMTEERIIENQTVLVKGTRIAAIGPSPEVTIPENAAIINGAGAYLMPGLADMHMHTRPGWVTDYPVSPLNLYLANGVTTVRCFGPRGGSGAYVLRWRDEIRKGKRIGPAIYTCGPILYGPVKDPRGVVRAQRADLILVNGNPLVDVANLKGLLGVMAAGTWYDKAALREMSTSGIHSF